MRVELHLLLIQKVHPVLLVLDCEKAVSNCVCRHIISASNTEIDQTTSVAVQFSSESIVSTIFVTFDGGNSV